MKLLILLLIPVSVSAQHFKPFSGQDLILQSAYTAITIIDWSQTKEFVSQGIREMNPILGKYPSQTRIDNLIISAIVAHGLITYALPPKYRFYWQSFFIGVESIAVCNTQKNMMKNGFSLPKYNINCEGSHKIDFTVKF